jgi:SnoaL-like domain
MKSETMITEESRHIATSMYDAAIKGDMAAFISFIDDDTSFHEPPCLPYGGSYCGRNNLMALFVKVAEYLDFSSIKIDYILAGGHDVLTSLRIKTRTLGVEIRVIEQAVVRNGKVVDLRIFPFDPIQITSDKT